MGFLSSTVVGGTSLLGALAGIVTAPIGAIVGGGGALSPISQGNTPTTSVSPGTTPTQTASIGGVLAPLLGGTTARTGGGLLGGLFGGGVGGLLKNPLIQGLGGGALGSLLTSLIGGEEAAAVGPIGKPKLRTIVVAIYQNGYVEERSNEEGTPFIMSRAMQTTKRTLNAIATAHKKVPRKMVRQSKTKQLTDAAVDAAMRNVTQGDGCCPKTSCS